MAKDNQMQMPSSGAGITRYFDDYKSKIQLKPAHVLVLAALIVLVIVFLHIQA